MQIRHAVSVSHRHALCAKVVVLGYTVCGKRHLVIVAHIQRGRGDTAHSNQLLDALSICVVSVCGRGHTQRSSDEAVLFVVLERLPVAVVHVAVVIVAKRLAANLGRGVAMRRGLRTGWD